MDRQIFFWLPVVLTAPHRETKELVVSFAVILLLVAVFGAGIWFFCRSLYWTMDHGKWSKGANPNKDAQIVGVSSKTMLLLKNDMRYITTVTFSDGYVFKTAKTDRTEHLFTYEISLDEHLGDEIIKEAVRWHDHAVNVLLEHKR